MLGVAFILVLGAVPLCVAAVLEVSISSAVPSTVMLSMESVRGAFTFGCTSKVINELTSTLPAHCLA